MHPPYVCYLTMHRSKWGTGVMGHLGDWAHGHKILNTAGVLTMLLQYIDMDVFYLNTDQFLPDGLILVHFLMDFKIRLLLASLLRSPSLAIHASLYMQ